MKKYHVLKCVSGKLLKIITAVVCLDLAGKIDFK